MMARVHVNAATLVIVLVGAGEAGSDWAAGALQTLREGLDRRVMIELRETLEAEPPPEGVFVVSVELSRDRRKVSLQCRVPKGRSGKELDFKKTDRELDRGRSIGYALTALLPELKAEAAPPPVVVAPPPPEPPPAAPEPAPAPAPAPEPPQVRTLVVEAPREPGRLGLEVTAFVSSSFVSSNPGFGGSLTAELMALDWLGVRLGGSGAFGNSPIPLSTVREVILRAGLRAAMLRTEHLALSAVGHALLVQLEMYRLGSEEEAWRGGAELSLELAFMPSRMLALFVKPTARTTFGAIQVYVNEQRVGAITAFVFALELGLRVNP